MTALTKTIPQLVKSASSALILIKRLEIVDDESMRRASSMLDKIALHAQAVDARRKEEKDPHLKAGNAVDSKYKPLKQLLADAEKLLRDKMREPLRLQREAQENALAKVEARGGKVGKDTLAVAHGAARIDAPETIQETSKLRWEVEDIDRVPKRFLRTIVDEHVVERELEETEGRAKIPGLRIWREYDFKRKGVVRHGT